MMIPINAALLHGPEGRARHSVRAGTGQWANGAQGTDAPYLDNLFMATMRDLEIVEAAHEPQRSVPRGHSSSCCISGWTGVETARLQGFLEWGRAVPSPVRKLNPWPRGVYLACLVLVGCVTEPEHRIASGPAASTAEQRAVAYLVREVPLWSKENKCFSCHNNGDAARALYVASRQSYPVPKHALEDTTAWLAKPDQWEHNKGDPGFSDKRLARIQFAAALLTAVETSHVTNARVLARAGDLVAELQDEDGAWRIGADDLVGSPATYGTYLATGMALRTLRAARSEHLRNAIGKAEHWLHHAPVRNVIEAAAVLLASQKGGDAEGRVQRQECLNLIKRGQSEDGGWGPYVTSAPEAFDTALVLLALAGLRPEDEIAQRIQRGRKFLLAMQQADGSWPETTRPAGAESYAQRLSTTGWAALALLRTNGRGAEH